jgi:hypothetical protein
MQRVLHGHAQFLFSMLLKLADLESIVPLADTRGSPTTSEPRRYR